MPTPTTETRNWRTLITLTLTKVVKQIFDNVSQGSAFFDTLLKSPNGFKLIDSLGDRASIPILHTLADMHVFSGADELQTAQPDTHTRAFYDWTSAAIPITITGEDRDKNSGEEALFNLLEERFTVAKLTAPELFNKRLLQGDANNSDSNSLSTPWVDPTLGRSFIDPIFKFVKLDPTTGVVGGIDPAATGNSFWQSLVADMAADSTFAAQDDQLDLTWIQCLRGPLGAPNIHLMDEATFRWYKKLRRSYFQETQFSRIDVPWENVAFHGAPAIPEQFMPNISDDDTVLADTEGSCAMLNTNTFQLQVNKDKNFSVMGPLQPATQEATIWYLIWRGAFLCGNRRKNAVLHGIDTTVAS